MTDPRQRHWVASKHILRYLHGTIAYGIRYASIGGMLLLEYIDSDSGGNIVDLKSTSRYYFILVSSIISWSSRNQG